MRNRIQNPEEKRLQDIKYFERVCFDNRITLSDLQREKLQKFVSLLLEWNARINLISRKDENDIWRNHILHSVTVLTQYQFLSGEKYFDLGTGGGFPGIPLAIMNPDSEFVLCDSIQKKIKVVDEIKSQLSLSNVKTIASRAEDCAKDIHLRYQFNAVFARAVTSLRELIKYSQHLFHPEKEKLLIAWKGGDISEELGEINRMKNIESIQIRSIHLIQEPYFEEQQKHLVYVRLQ